MIEEIILPFKETGKEKPTHHLQELTGHKVKHLLHTLIHRLREVVVQDQEVQPVAGLLQAGEKIIHQAEGNKYYEKADY